MKIKDFIEVFDGCVDVSNNYVDDGIIAYCGEKLTDEGKANFAEALDLEIESLNEDYVTIKIDEGNTREEECERRFSLMKNLFFSIAGYCDAEDWDKWFIE